MPSLSQGGERVTKKIDHQTLREAAEKAKKIETGMWQYDRVQMVTREFRSLATPDTILSLLDEIKKLEDWLGEMSTDYHTIYNEVNDGD